MTAMTAPAIRRHNPGGALMPVGILAIVAMMVLPLPAVLLDGFFVLNILVSLLVLMVAMHSYRPLDFSSFPSVLLIATVLRLALNVASTRIVLSDGHTGSDAAGRVIEAFGQFVIAGNFAVGIFVFAILVIINLVVITKGAGRVSEVSARFTLDAMPGKQMAIDADLNAGILTPEEAKARRAEVAEEADFYGSMDGASKFVKGDAVAGILILLVNILGGMIIGTSQHGMSLGDAAQAYVLLSIGDGLVAQIPSLLLSIATAIIVTRVSSTHDMAGHIGEQMVLPRAWIPAAAVLGILGLVPGMPTLLFLVAATAAGAVAWFAVRKAAASGTGDGTAGADTQDTDQPGKARAPEAIVAEDVTDYSPISIQIGYGLIGLIDGGTGSSLISRITSIRRDVSRDMGFVVPGVRIRDDLSMPSGQYRIRIGRTIVAEDVVHPDRKLALPGGLSQRKLKGLAVKDPSFGLDAVWILPHQQAEAEADDHVVVEPDSVVATHLSQILYRNAADLLGPDDVEALLENLERLSPTLVQSVVPKLVPLHVLTSVLRTLLADRIPISDLRRILEGLSEMAGRNLTSQDMAEALRPALAPLLIQQIIPLNQPLPLVTLAPELEQILIRARQQAGNGPLVIDMPLAQSMLRHLNSVSEDLVAQGKQPLIVVSAQLRRAFAAYLRAQGDDSIVLAVNELPDNRRIEIVATLGENAAPQTLAAGT
ncbi:flagellar biosynthesis protein FlhA [Meridianimarinicoccus sp. RP-17]|uniref:flagellar biosynthesis protein FlhA n=1 Tax=Meridianimarinicoccus zhengii TaxID=2056810 RepID=UPI000DAF00B8|nr:flagellar biosynthesis protein FlhA [Phycocomes zhengii]